MAFITTAVSSFLFKGLFKKISLKHIMIGAAGIAAVVAFFWIKGVMDENDNMKIEILNQSNIIAQQKDQVEHLEDQLQKAKKSKAAETEILTKSSAKKEKATATTSSIKEETTAKVQAIESNDQITSPEKQEQVSTVRFDAMFRAFCLASKVDQRCLEDTEKT